MRNKNRYLKFLQAWRLLLGVGLGFFLSIYGQAFSQEAVVQEFSGFSLPTNDQPEVIGSYANGCLLGARELAKQGPGFQTMRQSRNRHWGHPILINYIEKLAYERQKKGLLLLVGDMSQPRGGLMSYAHVSHQTGLDVDLWLDTMVPEDFKAAYVETLGANSMVDKAAGTLNNYWYFGVFDFVATAASFPEVDRIFINPVLKKELCRINPDAPWQYRVRPWFGHDDHIHVRLKCPANDKECLTQAPIPNVSGCNADLDNWIHDQSEYALYGPKGESSPPKPRPPYPPRCQVLLF